MSRINNGINAVADFASIKAFVGLTYPDTIERIKCHSLTPKNLSTVASRIVIRNQSHARVRGDKPRKAGGGI
jgi:hypothetical protein